MQRDERSIVMVIGSINADLVVGVERLPLRGETILANEFQQHLGGKGANQAVAAALLGADAAMVGCVGDDGAGARALRGLDEAGVDHSRVRISQDVPTGTALITVGRGGENTIVVVPGANDHVSVADVDQLGRELASCAAIVLQLEVPDDVVLATVQAIADSRRDGADARKPWVVFNPSPFRRSALPPPGTVDVLLVNEVEAEAMSGFAVKDPFDAATAARRLVADLRPGGCVVVTLGVQGAVALLDAVTGEPSAPVYIPAVSVEAVDTTGAGDVFTGGLVAHLCSGHSLADALRFATAAAALTVTRPGAQSSFPRREEVEQLLSEVEPARPLNA